MGSAITISDGLMILATALSPLIAVQVTQILKSRSDKKERQIWIFKNLMSTRAQQLSPMHVQALNSISLEFSNGKIREKPILDIWQQYLDHLGAKEMDPKMWIQKKIELLVDLLYEMGRYLGYGFNKTEIKNGIYAPIGHEKTDSEFTEMRELMIAVLKGERQLPIKIQQET